MQPTDLFSEIRVMWVWPHVAEAWSYVLGMWGTYVHACLHCNHFRTPLEGYAGSGVSRQICQGVGVCHLSVHVCDCTCTCVQVCASMCICTGVCSICKEQCMRKWM